MAISDTELILNAKRKTEEYWKDIREKIRYITSTYGENKFGEAIRNMGGRMLHPRSALILIDSEDLIQLYMTLSVIRTPKSRLQKIGYGYKPIDIWGLSDEDRKRYHDKTLRKLEEIREFLKTQEKS